MPRCPDYLSTLKLAALALLACLSVVPGTLSPASAQCLAANQWAYGSCGRSGGGFSGGSGGGNNIAAGLGVAAAGAGFLGALLEAAEEHRQQEQEQQAANNAREAEAARRAHAARQAYCYENWRQAANDINAGNATLNQWNPGGAIGYYERAISLLSRCGDARNIAIARRNLEAARQKYAAVRDDNRVQDAISRYGGGNAYRVSTNPFDAAPAPATPNAATNGLRINPVDVYG